MTQQKDATQLLHALEELGSPQILVVGDLILDRYTWGNAERISQEAPVIVLRADHRETRLGGASNVCAMLRGLEAQVACAGVAGQDEAGDTLCRMLDEDGIHREMVMIDPQRPTTVKERFMGRAAARHPNQILRVDSETREPLDRRLEDELVRSLQASIARYDAVLISDYGKGVCTSRVLRVTIEACRIAGVPVLVDPMRTDNFGSYRGATVLKPNRVETESASGCRIHRPEDAFRAGTRLCEQLDLATAIITLDRDGMALVPRRGTPGLYATQPRAVYDITGAGDVVLALLGICWARGVAPEAAVQLGNVAGALEVERTGVSKVTREEIRCELMAQSRPGLQKILTAAQLGAFGRQQRRVGRKVVFTNGCFDLLHVGHVTYLADAAAMGDVLVVGVNSDASVRSLKGAGRPVISEMDRAAMLAALACVDAVVVFDDSTPHRLLEVLRPDVLVKGGTYAPHEVVGREVVEAYGGEVRVTSVVDGISTTRIVQSLSGDVSPATVVPLSTERKDRWREAG
jgi:D-beta-D-heptose 7-phosphate kinase/D-beta-D-heptose 1-phosphate adenosyltransferase